MDVASRILVVDDQAEIRELTASILEAEGYDVRLAADGHEAMRSAFRERFDLVLLDVNMPEMDGWETLRLMKTDEDLAAVPVVLFTVKGEVRDQVHALQLGASGYVTKPFAVDDLLSRIRRVLDERRPGGRPSDPRVSR